MHSQTYYNKNDLQYFCLEPKLAYEIQEEKNLSLERMGRLELTFIR